MNNTVFDSFVRVEKVPQDVLNYYYDKLPKELLVVWKKYGFGSLLGGYLKIVNPADYQEIIANFYFRGDISIPILVTGFGDIISWENNEIIRMARFKDGDFKGIAAGFKYFWGDLSSENFLKRNFELDLYREAVSIHGEPSFDECFGFVPLLGLGGAKKVENLKKVKIREHIELIGALVGGIGR